MAFLILFFLLGASALEILNEGQDGKAQDGRYLIQEENHHTSPQSLGGVPFPFKKEYKTNAYGDKLRYTPSQKDEQSSSYRARIKGGESSVYEESKSPKRSNNAFHFGKDAFSGSRDPQNKDGHLSSPSLPTRDKEKKRKRKKRKSENNGKDPLQVSGSSNLVTRRKIPRTFDPAGITSNKFRRARLKRPTKTVKIRRRIFPKAKALSTTPVEGDQFSFRKEQENTRARTPSAGFTNKNNLQPTTTTNQPTSTVDDFEDSAQQLDYDIDYDYLYDAYDELFGSESPASGSQPHTQGKSAAPRHHGLSNPIPLPAVHLEAISQPNRLVPFPVNHNQLFPQQVSRKSGVFNTLSPSAVAPSTETQQKTDRSEQQDSVYDYDYEYEDDLNFQDDLFYDYDDDTEKQNNIFDQFSYGYKVDAKETGNFQSRTEERDGETVTGSYEVALPDGRIQVVTYVADGNGFRADVTYKEDSNPVVHKAKPRLKQPAAAALKPRPQVNRNPRRRPFQSHTSGGLRPIPLGFNSINPKVQKNPRPTPVSNHVDEEEFELAITPTPEFRLTPRPVSQTTSHHFVDDFQGPQILSKNSHMTPFPIFQDDDEDDEEIVRPNFNLNHIGRVGQNLRPQIPERSLVKNQDFPSFEPSFSSVKPPFEDGLDSRLNFRRPEPAPKPIPPLGHREVARIPPNPFLRNNFHSDAHRPVKPQPKQVSLQGTPHSPFDLGHLPFPPPHNGLIPPGFPRQDPNFPQISPLGLNKNLEGQNPNNPFVNPAFRRPNVHPPLVPQTFLLDQRFNIRPEHLRPIQNVRTNPATASVDFSPDIPLAIPSPNPFKVDVDSSQVTPFTPNPLIPHTTPIPVTIHPLHPINPDFGSNFVTTPEPDYDIYDLSQFPGHLELLRTPDPPLLVPDTNLLLTSTPSPLNLVTTEPSLRKQTPLFFQYSSADGTPSPTLLYQPNNPVFLRSFGQTHAIPLLLPVSSSGQENPHARPRKRLRERNSETNQDQISESVRTLNRQDIYPEPVVRFR